VSKEIILVPDLGGAETVDVIELGLSPGDVIAVEDAILVLESDKATMDVPSSRAGTLIKYLVAEGDTVKVGDPIAEIDLDLANLEAEPEELDEAEIADTSHKHEHHDEVIKTEQKEDILGRSENLEGPEITSSITSSDQTNNLLSTDLIDSDGIYAGPAVRMLARELGVSLKKITGRGPKGRILKDDVNDYVKSALNSSSAAIGSSIPNIPDIDFSQFGAVEIAKMSKIQKITSLNMQRSWLNVPHVTQFDETDITDLDAFRKSLKSQAEARGVRITPVAFLLKAIGIALKDNPEFNRSLMNDGESFVQKNYCHIGLAVDAPKGLMVPVIRDVNVKGLWEIAEDVVRVAGLARDGKLKPSDMQGGCFTLSSLGAIGGNGFTPIVNSPELGILGVSNAKIQPVWDGAEFKPRLMLPLTLSYDHRLINGGSAGRFLTQVNRLLSDIRLMSL
jgi:pyruvate dehydrogenase E2 component (dihydrolipoamide acetyltransferase)